MRNLITLALLSTLGCSARDAVVPSPQAEQTLATTPAATTTAAPIAPPETSAESGRSAPDAADVGARITTAAARLQSSAAGLTVWSSITAHGGLEAWYGSGFLRYRFNYQPAGRPATDTHQVVDPWSSRARHRVVGEDQVEFGWDGENAWLLPGDAQVRTNVRFWSLTPYYFVGMPFVLADPGVELEALPDAEFEGVSYDIVKATFASGTGDAPDDYYVLYFDKTAHLLRALRYVVSYPGFRPDGGHGPEKLMSYDAQLQVGELTLASRHRTFKFAAETGVVGEKVTDVEVTELGWDSQLQPDYFAAPAGSRLIEGWKN